MKIRTTIKAGGLNATNHSEKTAIENNNAIEQKQTKISGKKLRRSKETLKELRGLDLKQIAGGRMADRSWDSCTACSCACNHNEKIMSNNNSIKQKQTSGKKLRLGKETLRILKDSDLKQIAGGRRPESSTCDCGTSGC